MAGGTDDELITPITIPTTATTTTDTNHGTLPSQSPWALAPTSMLELTPPRQLSKLHTLWSCTAAIELCLLIRASYLFLVYSLSDQGYRMDSYVVARPCHSHMSDIDRHRSTTSIDVCIISVCVRGISRQDTALQLVAWMIGTMASMIPTAIMIRFANNARYAVLAGMVGVAYFHVVCLYAPPTFYEIWMVRRAARHRRLGPPQPTTKHGMLMLAMW